MMSNRQITLAVLCVTLFAVAAWAPVWFVQSKIGGPPPCEVSNTCGWWLR